MTELTLTSLGGEYMDSATIVEWLVRDGDIVRQGQPVVVVETAKASNEIEAPADGVISIVAGDVGIEVNSGEVLARIAASSSSPGSAEAHGTELDGADLTAEESSVGPLRTALESDGSGFEISVAARRYAKKHGIDEAAIEQEFRGKRVQIEDLQGWQLTPDVAKSRPVSGQAPNAGGKYRKAMASAMSATVDIPRFSLTKSYVIDALLERRCQAKAEGSSLSVNSLLVHAIAATLAEQRQLLRKFQGRVAVPADGVSISIGIATEAGLVAPVIHHADRLGPDALHTEIARLRERAEQLSLSSAELEGGCVTISNLGMFGIDRFEALVPPGHAAAVALGAPNVTATPGPGGEIRWVRKIEITLSADHRILDGVDIARFLLALGQRLN